MKKFLIVALLGAALVSTDVEAGTRRSRSNVVSCTDGNCAGCKGKSCSACPKCPRRKCRGGQCNVACANGTCSKDTIRPDYKGDVQAAELQYDE